MKPNRKFDLFAGGNALLFVLMCAMVYRGSFIASRGATNLLEFHIYAVAIFAAIVLGWIVFRRYPFPGHLLVLLEVGILLHFAGGFLIFDGRRLYDLHWLGLRYDKYVHFSNAMIGAYAGWRLFQLRNIPLDAVNRFLLIMVVLGCGALIEILEYFVCVTVPMNGVGDYDNNLQDMLANLVGAVFCVNLLSLGPVVARTGQVLQTWLGALAAPVLAERDLEDSSALAMATAEGDEPP